MVVFSSETNSYEVVEDEFSRDELELEDGVFPVRDFLGFGRFGMVVGATNTETGENVAIKVMNKKHIKKSKIDVQKEIEIMKRLKHQHVIRLYDEISDSKNMYLVLELAEGGDLWDRVTQNVFDERTSHYFFHQLIKGLDYCHQRGVVHRDLKLENLLLDGKDTLKICDFGLSETVKGDTELNGTSGSKHYTAPEVWRALYGQTYSGPPTDVWSCGVILFAMVFGCYPFEVSTTLADCYEYRMLLQKNEYPYPDDVDDFSTGLKSMLDAIFVTDPERRATISDIKSHPWFRGETGINRDNLLTMLPQDQYEGDFFQDEQEQDDEFNRFNTTESAVTIDDDDNLEGGQSEGAFFDDEEREETINDDQQGGRFNSRNQQTQSMMSVSTISSTVSDNQLGQEFSDNFYDDDNVLDQDDSVNNNIDNDNYIIEDDDNFNDGFSGYRDDSFNDQDFGDEQNSGFGPNNDFFRSAYEYDFYDNFDGLDDDEPVFRGIGHEVVSALTRDMSMMGLGSDEEEADGISDLPQFTQSKVRRCTRFIASNTPVPELLHSLQTTIEALKDTYKIKTVEVDDKRYSIQASNIVDVQDEEETEQESASEDSEESSTDEDNDQQQEQQEQQSSLKTLETADTVEFEFDVLLYKYDEGQPLVEFRRRKGPIMEFQKLYKQVKSDIGDLAVREL
eukprot:TRINITY_DN13907_c0_g1_i3.p1 TRINITY_DN13907_c0_g1~~TRINITY_DN13907_c0_g1_i3.p1  ORF type:complete len:677 (+),score=263.65 TRINITY_DN13907_c0_g1_i3:720-2750(+)